MATLAKLLQVDMGLPDMAKRLAAAGRGKDSILAHINPKEAKLLKKHGGSGKINPATGIMEFEDGDGGFGGYDTNEEPVSLTDAGTQQKVPLVDTTTSEPAPAAAPAPETKSQNAADTLRAAQSPLSPSTPVSQRTPITPVQEAGKTLQGPDYNAPGYQEEEKPGYVKRFTNFIQPVTQGAEDLSKALDNLTPYAKFGTQAFGVYQANKAANETREQAARNEAEIRALADPYRQQAALMQQQGQQILAAGQSGQLTPQQQQDLETRRAVALQQQAAAGVSGGTAAQQIEADIQRTAQSYAQQNISQGLALMSQAQTVAGTADTLVKQAIAQGYAGSQDANKLASEFYNAIGFSLPQTSSKGPTNA